MEKEDVVASLSEIAAVSFGKARTPRLKAKLVSYADEIGETAGKRAADEIDRRALKMGAKFGIGLGAGTAVGAGGGTYAANRLTRLQRQRETRQ